MKELIPECVLPSTIEQCLAACRWANRQGGRIRYKIHEMSKNKYFELKNLGYEDRPSGIIADTAYLMAAFAFKGAYKDGVFIDDAIGLGEVDDLKIESAKKERVKPQMKWLSLHLSDVNKLVSKGTSLRQMELFFMLERGHKISHTQIDEFLKMKGIRK